MREKVEHRPNLRRIVSNVAWLFSDKILRMGIGLLVGIWVARYLEPEQFGLLNFAIAYVALFSVFTKLGLQGIVVRDIVKAPSRAQETLGTSFALQSLGGIFAFSFAIWAINYLRPDDSLTKGLVAILGFTLVFKSSEVVKFWFESQVLSKYTVWTQNSIFLIIAVVKILMILSNAPLIAFAWAAFAEALFVAIVLLAVYAWREGDLSHWRVRFPRAKELLENSWPLFFADFAFIVYMKTDLIMLGQMAGNESVGVYSAAVRVSEIWYFVAISITASVYPSLIEAHKNSENLFQKRTQQLYDLMVILALIVALPMTILSGGLIDLLFGKSYALAGSILSVHIWAAVFVFIGKASTQWFLIHNRQNLLLQRSIIGAIINILFNYWMIPKFGGLGAAYSTIIAYAFIALLSDSFQRETRPMFWMKIKSFNLYRSICNFFPKRA